MEFITLTDDQAKEKFEEFYNDSALTISGMIPEEAQLYVDYFGEHTGIKEGVPGYIYSGKAINDHYNLIGDNKYPDDLHFLTIPSDAFENVMAIVTSRFQVGGRWFDDIVDNNARRG